MGGGIGRQEKQKAGGSGMNQKINPQHGQAIVSRKAHTCRDQTIELRREAEQKAWKALAGYKFWMFGYHAAQWVLLNRALDKFDREGNPFKELVQVAKEKIAIYSAIKKGAGL